MLTVWVVSARKDRAAEESSGFDRQGGESQASRVNKWKRFACDWRGNFGEAGPDGRGKDGLGRTGMAWRGRRD